jgi:hypothetical protein
MVAGQCTLCALAGRPLAGRVHACLILWLVPQSAASVPHPAPLAADPVVPAAHAEQQRTVPHTGPIFQAAAPSVPRLKPAILPSRWQACHPVRAAQPGARGGTCGVWAGTARNPVRFPSSRLNGNLARRPCRRPPLPAAAAPSNVPSLPCSGAAHWWLSQALAPIRSCLGARIRATAHTRSNIAPPARSNTGVPVWSNMHSQRMCMHLHSCCSQASSMATDLPCVAPGAYNFMQSGNQGRPTPPAACPLGSKRILNGSGKALASLRRLAGVYSRPKHSLCPPP